MQKQKPGFWMVLVPVAVAYLKYKGDPDSKSAARIYDLLDELGFLENDSRTKDSILKTIRRCLRIFKERLILD